MQTAINLKTVKSKCSAKKPKKTTIENNKQKKIKKFDDVRWFFCGEMYIEEDDQQTENYTM